MSITTIEQDVRTALDAVQDPEIPVTLRDLGVLRGVAVIDGNVHVVLRPTRTACPAREVMATRVRQAATMAGATDVTVTWEAASWTPDAVTAHGCQALRAAGYAAGDDGIVCPYCSSAAVRRAAEFGGAVCRIPYNCTACGSMFDSLGGAATSPSTG